MIMIVRHMLLSAVLAVLGCYAATLIYVVVMYALVSAQHSFNGVYPATVCALAAAVLGTQLACLYAARRHPHSLKMVIPFLSGALLFLIGAALQSIPGR